MRITSIRSYKSTDKVYDIEVKDYHNFKLNGIVSSNSIGIPIEQCAPVNGDFDGDNGILSPL